MKYCPNCEKPLADDAAFCGECGTAAVEMEPTPVAEEAVAVEPINEEIPEIEVAPIEIEPEQPATENAHVSPEAVSAVVASAKALLDKVPKKILMIAGAALAVIILLAVILSLIPAGTPDHALYIKDGELIYSTLKKGGDIITDEPTTYAMHMLSKDGEKLFFVEDGDLYWCPPTKPEKAEKIAGNVSQFLINEDGNRVTYQKDGDLYQSNLKEADRIASDVEGFIVTKDGKMVMYQKDDSMYVQKVGKDDKEKLGSSDSFELCHLSEDLKEFYFVDEDKFYFKKFGKDREEIARDVDAVITVYDNGDAYYVTEDDDGERTLYYYNGNKSVEICDNYGGYETVAAEKPVLIFNAYDDGESACMIAVKDKTAELDLEEASDLRLTEDGKKLYYLGDYEDDGTATLYEAKISGTKMKDAEEYDDEVAGYSLYNGHVVTRKDRDEETYNYSLWIDGKEADSDVASLRYDENSDKFYYTTEDDTLKVYKNKAKTIHEEVDEYTILPGGQVLFLYDISESSGEGDLYMYKGSGKAKKLDDSVSYIVPVYDLDMLYESIFSR